MKWLRKLVARQRLALRSALILMLALIVISAAVLMAALEANLRREVDRRRFCCELKTSSTALLSIKTAPGARPAPRGEWPAWR